MPKQTYNDSRYQTFTEDVAGALNGKEGYLVELTATGTIQLFNAGIPIGWYQGKLQGSNDCKVCMFGPTTLAVQNGAIVVGTRAKGAAGGKLTALGAAGRSVGVKIRPASNGADGDTIEVMPEVEILA